MTPDIELEWLIHYKCNYRCPYCFFEGMWEEVEARNSYRPLGDWIALWGRMRQKYNLTRLLITGGEPFIYPGFVDLVSALSRDITLGFDTNLACPRELVDDFTRKVFVDNISVALSFHPRFAQYNLFLDKALLLKDKGFRICVQYVSYPEQIDAMLDFKSKFEAQGFYFIPLPFRGIYRGKLYPDAHSEEEKSIVYRSGEHLVSEHKDKVDKLLHQVKSRQRLCRAGQAYARIDHDGTVYRCGASVSNPSVGAMGNIFDESFNFFEEPMPCEQEACPCESRWLV